MTTDDDMPLTDAERIDFSPESVQAALKFVRGSIETVIGALEDELKWLAEMDRKNNSNLGMVVIALANQYSGAPGFENRWNLREKK